MEVDNDIDAQLMQQFSSMGTTDKEVLISQFQNLLGNQLNPTSCAFFLDMNNWNLQEAIGSYYDYEQPSPHVNVPCMAFIKDITIGEGESVPTSTNFVKTWRVQNSGSEAWPPGCCLRFLNGEHMSTTERIMVDALQPGQIYDLSVNMTSPVTTGMFQGQWRMQTPTGIYFGDSIWVIIQVAEDGLLGVTQQFGRFGGDLAHQPMTNCDNPFASPTKINTDNNPSFVSPDKINQENTPSFASPNKINTDTAVMLHSAVPSMLHSPTPSMVTHPGSLNCSPVTKNNLQTAVSEPNLRTALKFEENTTSTQVHQSETNMEDDDL